MSDLRARLVDALANHQGICDGHTTTECWCGEEDSVRGNGIEWAEHAADVLLSLPGVAIVELETLQAIADAIRDDIRQARATDDDDHRSYLRGELQGVLQIYDLLAAANATEQSS